MGRAIGMERLFKRGFRWAIIDRDGRISEAQRAPLDDWTHNVAMRFASSKVFAGILGM